MYHMRTLQKWLTCPENCLCILQENFDDLLSSLRWSIITINYTRVDISLAKGFQSWIVSFIPYFKEWVGVEMFWNGPAME